MTTHEERKAEIRADWSGDHPEYLADAFENYADELRALLESERAAHAETRAENETLKTGHGYWERKAAKLESQLAEATREREETIAAIENLAADAFADDAEFTTETCAKVLTNILERCSACPKCRDYLGKCPVCGRLRRDASTPPPPAQPALREATGGETKAGPHDWRGDWGDVFCANCHEGRIGREHEMECAKAPRIPIVDAGEGGK